MARAAPYWKIGAAATAQLEPDDTTIERHFGTGRGDVGRRCDRQVEATTGAEYGRYGSAMASSRHPLAHQSGALYQDVQPTTERDGLVRFLDIYRSEVAHRVGELTDAEAATQFLPATAMTVGGIVKHLAWSEDSWFQGKMLGATVPEPWASAPMVEDPDWPFRSASEDSVDDLIALYGAACERSRSATTQFDSLDALAARPSFGRGPVNLRWLLIHMVDETARHAGHIDLLLDARP